MNMASRAKRAVAFHALTRHGEDAAEAELSADHGQMVCLAPAAGGRSSAATLESDESREDGVPEKRQKTAEAGELATPSIVHGQQVVGDAPEGAKRPAQNPARHLPSSASSFHTCPMCPSF